MTHVLVTAPFSESLLDKIRRVADEVRVEQMTLADGRWPEDLTTEAEVYYALDVVPRPEQAPNLRWVQTHYAGIDELVGTPLWHSDILITSASGVHPPNMAQYVFAQLLSWANHTRSWFRFQEQRQWPENRWETFCPVEIRGRTLGIVGYGSIGREIGRIAKAFGMEVLVTKRDARQPRDAGFTIAGTGDPGGDLPDRIYPGEATRSMLAAAQGSGIQQS